MKQQKSFQGLTTYGHEVLMSLQTQAKFFGTHFLHSYLSELGLIGEWQFKLWKNVCNIFRLPWQFDARFWRC